MSSAIQASLVQPCAAMSGSARSSSAGRTQSAAVAAVRPRAAAAAFRVQRASSRAAARRSAVCVHAVLNVTDDTFDEEVLKVRPDKGSAHRLPLLRACLCIWHLCLGLGSSACSWYALRRIGYDFSPAGLF